MVTRVCVDKLSKMTHIVSTTTHNTTKGMAKIFHVKRPWEFMAKGLDVGIGLWRFHTMPS